MWIKRLFQPFVDFLNPFNAIARELGVIRELYELEMAAKGIYRITEKPKRGDTEVSYMDDVPKKKSATEELVEEWEEESVQP